MMGDEPKFEFVPGPETPDQSGTSVLDAALSSSTEDKLSLSSLPEDTSSFAEERRIEEAAKNEYIRDQRWLGLKSWMKLVLTVLAAAVGVLALLSLGVVMAIHHLAPESWGWLSDEEINEIYQFTALVGGGSFTLQLARFIRGIF